MSLQIYWIDQQLGISPMPAGNELLPAETELLRQLQVDMLVSLLPWEESVMLGLEKQEELCTGQGIKLVRFAITDFSVPADMQEASAAVDKVNEALSAGKKVVVHCRGGIGRSSLFAAAVMIRKGQTWDKAFEAIRQCRGCKVPETEQQEAWVKKFSELLKK